METSVASLYNMNKYIIPVCDICKSKVYNLTISATSYKNCQEKIMEKFIDFSESDDYKTFLKELDKKDILIGEITDIEAL